MKKPTNTEARHKPRVLKNEEYNNVYTREIRKGVFVDIFDFLDLFEVNCPAVCSAIKKLLVAGKRGAKSENEDMQEALKSVYRSIELAEQRELRKTHGKN